MDLRATEEQKLLADSAARFLAKEYKAEHGRARANGSDGLDRAMWSRFAEMGWLGVGVPEDAGGIGGGPVETAILAEAFGRHLVGEPYLASVVLAGSILRAAGGKATELLGGIAGGERIVALAHGEAKTRYDLGHVATRAQRAGSGYKLTGDKSVVLAGTEADLLIVSARTAGAARDHEGVTLFLVPRDAHGLAIRGYRTNDGLRAADVALDGVAVQADAAIGPIDGGLPLIEQAVDAALVALAAEAVGAMDALIERTREYLRTRVQFGVPIGSFQVLQHRLVDMFMAASLARSTVEVAARALADADESVRVKSRLAAAAKVQAGRAGKLVGQEAVQLHGGMGMTDELAVGRYFKRLTMIDLTLGDADHHQRRFADLDG